MVKVEDSEESARHLNINTTPIMIASTLKHDNGQRNSTTVSHPLANVAAEFESAGAADGNAVKDEGVARLGERYATHFTYFLIHRNEHICVKPTDIGQSAQGE